MGRAYRRAGPCSHPALGEGSLLARPGSDEGMAVPLQFLMAWIMWCAVVSMLLVRTID
jgi:hypothetical protein